MRPFAIRHPRLLIGLLVLATVLVDVVAYSILAAGKTSLNDLPPVPLFLFYFGGWGMGFAQVSLAAIWVGYGGKWMPFATVLLVVTMLGWIPWMVGDSSPESVGSGIVGFSALAVSTLGPLGLARAVGVRFVHASDATVDGSCRIGEQRFQFSLAFLFSWLTAVAVVMALLRCTADFNAMASAVRELIDFHSLGATVAFGIVPLSALWTVLGTRRILLRLTVLSLVVGGTLLLLERSIEDGSTSIGIWWCAWMILIQVLWLLASLAVVRVAGFRLVRKRASVRASASSAAVVVETDAEQPFEHRLPMEKEER